LNSNVTGIEDHLDHQDRCDPCLHTDKCDLCLEDPQDHQDMEESRWYDLFPILKGDQHTTMKAMLWTLEVETVHLEDPIKEPRILLTTTLSFKITVMVNRDPTT